MGDDIAPSRGISISSIWESGCKDCRAERDATQSARNGKGSKRAHPMGGDAASGRFQYSSTWAKRTLERGNSRSDRCERHRRMHAQTIKAYAVPYIDLTVIGEVPDASSPTGPLGGLGPLPVLHEEKNQSVNLEKFEFGMTDVDILNIIAGLTEKRVGVIEAGTGTGKSTFMPFRLMRPPQGAKFHITDFGPIVVTEPRRAAATGVARYVGEELCFGCDSRRCGRHSGPGYPVGHQVSGEKYWDAACELIYVTDGTMINWVRDGQLAKFGLVIIDEAHERSENIDIILAQLRDQIARHKHLRVIVTSATLDKDFFVAFFGGYDQVFHYSVPAKKSFGYGVPLFVGTDISHDVIAQGVVFPGGLSFPGWSEEGPRDETGSMGEDLRATTRKLEKLRCGKEIPLERWRLDMPDAVTRQVVKIANGTEWGDILAFLPTNEVIRGVVEDIKSQLGTRRKAFDVYPLLSTTEKSVAEKAIAARSRGDRRKIVVSSNLAETSLTVKGVRYVVDSGLICQSEWDPELASGSFPTKPHSQSGLRQRWGRVGRDAPGWVFPLYTPEQFLQLPRNTPPDSTQANLETFYMKLISSGLDLGDANLPGSFVHNPDAIDVAGRHNIETFSKESERARRALAASGLVDSDGHLTEFGRELERFPGDGSAALAMMLSDQMACIHEVALALIVLSEGHLVGNREDCILRVDRDWPVSWRVRAAASHRALAVGCEDDLDVLLRVVSLWQAAANREQWCATWWVNGSAIEKALATMAERVGSLSAKMKKEATRDIDTGLAGRARAVLSRAMVSLRYRRIDGTVFRSEDQPEAEDVNVGNARLVEPADRILAFNRFRLPPQGDGPRPPIISGLVSLYPWADLGNAHGNDMGFELMLRTAERLGHPSENRESLLLAAMQHFPVGSVFDFRARSFGSSSSDIQFRAQQYAPPAYSGPRDEDDKGLRSSSGFDREWDIFGEAEGETPDEELATGMVEAGEVNDLPEDMATLCSGERRPSPSGADDTLFVLEPYLEHRELPSELTAVVMGYRLIDDRSIALQVEQVIQQNIPSPLYKPWEEVLVIAAAITSDHEREYLKLVREDRGDTFYLDVVRAGLDPYDGEFARRLNFGASVKIRVFPKRDKEWGATLLPAARLHLSRARPEFRRRKDRQTRFYPAFLVEAVNEFGNAIVELDHKDEATGISHRFQVRDKDLDSSQISKTEIGAPLLVALRPDRGNRKSRRSLPCDDPEIRRYAEQQSSYLEIREGRIRVKDGTDIPAHVLTGLMQATSGAEWTEDVFEFFEDSLHLSAWAVAPITPIPRIDLPVRLVDFIFSKKREIEERFSVELIVLRRESIVEVRGAERSAVEEAASLITELVRRPRLSVMLPAEGRGAIFGKQGSNLRKIEVLPGVQYLKVDGDIATIIGIDAANVENAMRCLIKPARGILTVPPNQKGRLLGKQWSTINSLLAMEFCSADNPDRGPNFYVTGPSRARIEAFFSLAKAYAPDASGQVIDVGRLAPLGDPPRPQTADSSKETSLEADFLGSLDDLEDQRSGHVQTPSETTQVSPPLENDSSAAVDASRVYVAMVLCASEEGGVQIAFSRDDDEEWRVPHGLVRKGEKELQTISRVAEEYGATILSGTFLFERSYRADVPDVGPNILIVVRTYLLKCRRRISIPQTSEIAWLDLQDAAKVKVVEDDKPALVAGLAKVTE